MFAQRRQREAWLRAAGFEKPDEEQQPKNVATNAAFMPWRRD